MHFRMDSRLTAPVDAHTRPLCCQKMAPLSLIDISADPAAAPAEHLLLFIYKKCQYLFSLVCSASGLTFRSIMSYMKG